MDLFEKVTFSLTLDTSSEIIEIGTHLLSDDGTHRCTTEDIENCDEYSDNSASNSINNIHRQGSSDGYLNVCEDYKPVTGNSRIIPGLNHSNSRTNAKTLSRGGTELQMRNAEDSVDCSICMMEEDHIDCSICTLTSMEEDEIDISTNFNLKTSTDGNPSPLQQASNNNDSGIDI